MYICNGSRPLVLQLEVKSRGAQIRIETRGVLCTGPIICIILNKEFFFLPMLRPILEGKGAIIHFSHFY
jgi:hypothetical protein